MKQIVSAGAVVAPLDAVTRAKLLPIPEQIETERLVLLAVDATHVDETFAAACESREQLGPWMAWANPAPTIEGVSAYHAVARQNWYARERLEFRIVEKAGGKFVGNCAFHHIDWTVIKLEIGYWLRTSASGHGYCTEAVNGLSAFAKQELHASRLEIGSDTRNFKSRAVAERCGFTLEGILKQNMRAPDGSLRDSCMYALVLV